MSISRRYKKLDIKSLFGGMGQKFFESQTKFLFGLGFIFNPLLNQLDILSDFDSNVVSGKILFPDYKYSQKVDYQGDGILYTMLDQSTGNPVVYLKNTTGTYLKKTFTDGDSEVMCGFSFADVFIVQYYHGVDSELKIATTDDSGNTWSEVTSDLTYYVDHIEIDNVLYVVDQNGDVWSSTDGISYTKYYDSADDAETIVHLEKLHGFLYYFAGKRSSAIMGRFENDLPVIVRRWHNIKAFDFGGIDDELGILIARNDEVVLYKHDFDFTEKMNEIDVTGIEVSDISIMGGTDERQYFVLEDNFALNDYRTRDIFVFTVDYSIFKYQVHADSSYGSEFHVYNYINYNGEDHFFVWDYTNDDVYVINANGEYNEATAYIDTSIINFEAQSIPKQLIVRHDPLPAGVTIKIYAQRNADAFDPIFNSNALILTVDTTDIIWSTFECPSGLVLQSLIFRIEVICDTATDFPKNISLELLYKEKGLEVSN